jgi:hypothetical protein
MLIRALQNNRTLPSTWLSVTLVSESFRRYCKVNLIRTTVRRGLTCFPHMHEPYASRPSESHARILVETILGKKAWPNPSVLLIALTSICGQISTYKKVVPITKRVRDASESAKVHALSQRSRPSYLACHHLLPSIPSARSGFRQPKSISFPTASHWRQARVLLDSHLNFHLACDC